MAGTADKNLEQIMARIREQVRMCKPVVGTAVSPSPAPFPVAPSEALALFPWRICSTKCGNVTPLTQLLVP